ncbi:MAG: FtsH protease activity modulator HflK [Bacteroidales bacterium]|jgi:membrane protease subunit HflK|nr:FtsH protease activity modulator HflK [Clostridiaceae bacterium]NLA94312.1 FtsH protease activity modulator HflK [Bacteroidales bacterium]
MSNQQFQVPPQVEALFKNVRQIVVGALVLVLVWTGFFQIGAEEVGIITRFGKYTREVNSGLNFKIPLIEGVVKVPVERQQKQEFGFRTVESNVRSDYTKRGTADESLMLTGDLNLADVEWVVQYRISNAYQYLFKVRHPEITLRDLSESSMRQVVGDRTVNEVLTVGRTEVALAVKDLIQNLSDEYELGICIEQVVLQDVNPPDPVKSAFNAVNEAQQEKETLINQAKSEYNRVIPHARGQARETIQKAEGYATARVNNAQGEATRFELLYQEYVKAPEVTRRRLYMETMQRVLPELGNKIITDQEGNNVLPLLQMPLSPANKQ